MINELHAHSGIIVNNNFGAPAPYLADNPNDTLNGLVRYKHSNFEIYDGYNKQWVTYFGQTVNITLDPRVQNVLSWVEQKMADEAREKELLEKHPALQKAKENYDIIRKLVENE
jgi:hypothetical protein